MSVETKSTDDSWASAGAALRALRDDHGADGEVLLRRSRGASLRTSRGTPPEAGSWTEHGLAVTARLPDGRHALAVDATWSNAPAVARQAALLAASGPAGEGARGRARILAPSVGDVPRKPPGHQAIAEWLARVERAARGVDERVVGLDVAQARVAIVDSYLAASDGTALHQRQVSCLAHASVVVRDGLRAATRAEAWAGAILSDDEADSFGRRAARSAIVHLTGSGAAPPTIRRILLAPGALADLTFGFGMALLGSAALEGAGPGVDPRLLLVEDAALDAVARVVPADGIGRPLRPLPIVRGGSWRRPRTSASWMRPGLADLPRPAWMRLTWGWSEPLDEDALVERMGQGLVVESLHASRLEAGSGRWTGSASGWWVEDGRRRHAVAGAPITMTVAQVIRGAVAGGGPAVQAHPSGTVRAIPLLVVLEE